MRGKERERKEVFVFRCCEASGVILMCFASSERSAFLIPFLSFSLGSADGRRQETGDRKEVEKKREGEGCLRIEWFEGLGRDGSWLGGF